MIKTIDLITFIVSTTITTCEQFYPFLDDDEYEQLVIHNIIYMLEKHLFKVKKVRTEFDYVFIHVEEFVVAIYLNSLYCREFIVYSE